MDPIQLTKALVAIHSINPNDGEKKVAHAIGPILEANGFSVTYNEYAPNRVNLIAQKSGTTNHPSLCFSGHMDTVPLGAVAWTKDPFQGDEDKDKLYGRGSSDMKSGLAVITTAAIKASRKPLRSDLTLIFTAGEETGCEGCHYLSEYYSDLLPVGALVIAEPTSNYPLVGHKGAFWVTVQTNGSTAHGSVPEQGVNAIYKAIDAIKKLKDYDFATKDHPLLNSPTLNVGTINGGIATNSVPDQCRITVDIRTTPLLNHQDLFNRLKEKLGSEVDITPMIDTSAMVTDETHPWVQSVFDLMIPYLGKRPEPKGVNYFTDASVLKPALGNPPTLILGPGEGDMAHKTDEFVFKSKILECEEVYIKLIDQWNQ